jgi:hypothetical protein
MNVTKAWWVIIVASIFCSCAVRKVRYVLPGTVRISAKIPRGFTREKIISGPSVYYQYRYKYPDSSWIYITDELAGIPNSDNMQRSGLYTEKTYSIFFPDQEEHLFLEGTDTKGYHWGNQFSGRYSMGYVKSNSYKKDAYNKAIQHMRVDIKHPKRWWLW